MIEQTDHRSIYGINTLYSIRKSLGNTRTNTKVGGSYRGDQIDLSLWHSPNRQRSSVSTDNNVHEVNMAFWLEEDLVLSPHKNIDIYLNRGSRFHSNDAMDVIIAQKINEIKHAMKDASLAEIEQALRQRNFDPLHAGIKTLPRAVGTELGTRISLGQHILASLAGWYLFMEEELVFVGDEGSTEISGATRRIGLDAEIRLQLAPRFLSQGGINFIHPNDLRVLCVTVMSEAALPMKTTLWWLKAILSTICCNLSNKFP